MKLKNKRTGEIKDWDFGNWYQHILNPDNKESYECTLSEFIDRTAEFREEWEDYEEPKEYWFLSGRGEVKCIEDENTVFDKDHKSIGNYFEAEEEAELAVRKLKAWKRLRDKGFRFTGVEDVERTIRFEIPFRAGYDSCEAEADLDICFGGEE